MSSGYQTPSNRDVVGVNRQRDRQRAGTLTVGAYYVGHLQRQQSSLGEGTLSVPATDNVGGLHRAPRLTDERVEMCVEPLVDFERARVEAISMNRARQPFNPF